jgi:hypothetical protein
MGCGSITTKGSPSENVGGTESNEKMINSLAADAEKDDILANLRYGSILRTNKRYGDCIGPFDKAEALYKAAEEDKILHEVEKAVTAALANETLSAYTGRIYEMTLLNTYKSMAFLCDGKTDDARIEINRALDRQRRAKEYFDDELKQEKEKIEKKQAASAKGATNSDKNNSAISFISPIETINKSDVKQKVAKEYSNLENFEAFANYTNPFVTYFAGLYFLLNKDYAKAVDLLKESLAMCPSNPVVQDDINLAMNLAASINVTPTSTAPTEQKTPSEMIPSNDNTQSNTPSKVTKTKSKHKKAVTDKTPQPPAKSPEPPLSPAAPSAPLDASQRFAWIIFENGRGPSLESISIPIPLFLVTKKSLLTKIALPRMVSGIQAADRLLVTNNNQSITTCPLVYMDNVAMTEFKARFTAVLLRAIESATAKALMQAAGKKYGGDIGLLATTVYSVAVTQADTRHWPDLPASYEVAKVRIDQTDGVIQVNLPSAQITQIQLDPSKNHLVFVGLRYPSSAPYIDSVSFD